MTPALEDDGRELNCLFFHDPLLHVKTADLHSPSPAPRIITASVRRVVVAAVPPSDVVQVVHGTRPHAVTHVAAASVALLRDAADGAHGLVAVVHGGQSWRL